MNIKEQIRKKIKAEPERYVEFREMYWWAFFRPDFDEYFGDLVSPDLMAKKRYPRIKEAPVVSIKEVKQGNWSLMEDAIIWSHQKRTKRWIQEFLSSRGYDRTEESIVERLKVLRDVEDLKAIKEKSKAA